MNQREQHMERLVIEVSAFEFEVAVENSV